SDDTQQLIRIEKTETGLDYRELNEVLFVPLVEGLPAGG
ncbi:MAG: protein-L-isoaspartate O-methyltransferase, partial [Pseudomonadota bacterium]